MENKQTKKATLGNTKINPRCWLWALGSAGAVQVAAAQHGEEGAEQQDPGALSAPPASEPRPAACVTGSGAVLLFHPFHGRNKEPGSMPRQPATPPTHCCLLAEPRGRIHHALGISPSVCPPPAQRQPRTASHSTWAAAQLARTHGGFWAAGGRGALGVPFCHGTRSLGGGTWGFGANGDDSAHAARTNQGCADTACPFCLSCTSHARGGSFAAGENPRLLLCVPSS